ncbi:MAG: hypothetical protein E6713_02595 [Sporomusaceae bacterium]|nr:hypothetical protein [Sporomusaceae bacterium]
MAVTTLHRWHLTSAYVSSHMLLLLGGGDGTVPLVVLDFCLCKQSYALLARWR